MGKRSPDRCTAQAGRRTGRTPVAGAGRRRAVRVGGRAREAVSGGALSGWWTAEFGRQPWIVWNLLRTDGAQSPNVTFAQVATSLGMFVLRTACLQQAAWHAAGLRPVTIAVNISALQFRRQGFLERVRRIIDETGAEIPSDLASRTISPSIDSLRGRRVVGLAGGISKLRAIQAVLASGVLTELMALRFHVNHETRAFLTTGILGGFTTFSSFSMEFWTLFERGQMPQAAAYVGASVIIGIAACGVGMATIRQLPA